MLNSFDGPPTLHLQKRCTHTCARFGWAVQCQTSPSKEAEMEGNPTKFFSGATASHSNQTSGQLDLPTEVTTKRKRKNCDHSQVCFFVCNSLSMSSNSNFEFSKHFSHVKPQCSKSLVNVEDDFAWHLCKMMGSVPLDAKQTIHASSSFSAVCLSVQQMLWCFSASHCLGTGFLVPGPH